MSPDGRVAGEFKSPLRHSEPLVLQRSRSDFGSFANRLLTADRVLPPKGARLWSSVAANIVPDTDGKPSAGGGDVTGPHGTGLDETATSRFVEGDMTRQRLIRPERPAADVSKSPLQHELPPGVPSVHRTGSTPPSSSSAARVNPLPGVPLCWVRLLIPGRVGGFGGPVACWLQGPIPLLGRRRAEKTREVRGREVGSWASGVLPYWWIGDRGTAVW